MRVEQNNSVQTFSALNAFRSTSTVTKPHDRESNDVIDNTSSGVKSAPKSLLERVDTEDIRRCAGYVGENNITDDDIKYGLIYGRSVIAEWLC